MRGEIEAKSEKHKINAKQEMQQTKAFKSKAMTTLCSACTEGTKKVNTKSPTRPLLYLCSTEQVPLTCKSDKLVSLVKLALD